MARNKSTGMTLMSFPCKIRLGNTKGTKPCQPNPSPIKFFSRARIRILIKEYDFTLKLQREMDFSVCPKIYCVDIEHTVWARTKENKKVHQLNYDCKCCTTTMCYMYIRTSKLHDSRGNYVTTTYLNMIFTHKIRDRDPTT